MDNKVHEFFCCTPLVEDQNQPFANFYTFTPTEEKEVGELTELEKARAELDRVLFKLKEEMLNPKTVKPPTTDIKSEETSLSNLSLNSPGPSKPGRKRIQQDKNKVLFQLCQKSFELKNVNENHSLYRLARVWLYGKDEPRCPANREENPNEKMSDDLEIMKDAKLDKKEASEFMLPQPSPPDSPIASEPMVIERTHSDEPVDLTTSQGILKSYLPHWKAIKQNCIKQRQMKDKPYHKSFAVLKDMYEKSQKKVFVLCSKNRTTEKK
ncbi:hypothetical protein T4A_8719 [Trichinella pseudospiralis]|uniref:Protein lin-37-like protein n=1 Tax=Trichinella pseudospiralis TaxID=6337 RepID=A0A0V1DWZ5_TRIPS|nr:hypothetical protein T4A_8719 [Trichinella pseudospiralis]